MAAGTAVHAALEAELSKVCQSVVAVSKTTSLDCRVFSTSLPDAGS